MGKCKPEIGHIKIVNSSPLPSFVLSSLADSSPSAVHTGGGADAPIVYAKNDASGGTCTYTSTAEAKLPPSGVRLGISSLGASMAGILPPPAHIAAPALVLSTRPPI